MGSPDGSRGGRTAFVRHLGSIGTEVFAGATVAFLGLPISLAAGILIYAPLGVDFLGLGASVGLYGAIIGGFVAALASSSSFIIWSPGASIGLVLTGAVSAVAAAYNSVDLAILAVVACVLLGGLFQAFAGAIGLGNIVRYTPYPVLAGFVTGVGLLIGIRQIEFVIDQIDPNAGLSAVPLPLFVALQLALVLLLRFAVPRVPWPIVLLVFGTGLYHLAAAIWPDSALGGVLGPMPDLELPRVFSAATTIGALAPHWKLIVLTAATLAIVSSIEALFTIRHAQRLSDIPISARRHLCALGVSNCASALVGGAAITTSPSQTTLNHRLGGRTRVSALAASIVLLLLAVFGADLLSTIPVATLSALLFGVALQMFDKSSVVLLLHAVTALARRDATAGKDLMNAVVVVIVAASVGSGQVVLGTILGVILSAAIFIAQMSRPPIRRALRVPEAISKRARPRSDMDRLRTLGHAIAVFELEGALFFGNAEDLATGIRSRAQDARFVVLDFGDVSDIDISGAAVLSDLVSRARSAGVHILICNVGQRCRAAAAELHARGAKEFADRDMALEWAEDRLLAGESDYHAAVEVPLEQHELLAGLSPSEVAFVAASLRRREFPTGQVLCAEGEKADSMWMIVSGSVSIRVRCGQPGETRRIASRTAGTMVGEMALLERGRRSATVVADDPVVAYELDGKYFTELLATSPAIANRILHNIAVELAGRLRIAAGALGSIRS